MQFIGVHIKPYEINYVLLQWTSRQPTLMNQGQFSLSLDWNEDQRKIEISNYLTKLSKKYPSPQYSYIFNVPQKYVSVHHIEFPFKERFKVSKALPYEIEEKIPYTSLQDLSYSSKMTYTQNKISHVLSFISSKQDLENQIQFIESTTKIKPAYLIPVSSAISNILENWQEAPPSWKGLPKEQELHLYLSYDSSTAIVTAQNRVVKIYNINWSLKHAIEDVSAKYKRTTQQALDYFIKNAFITKEQNTHLAPLLKTIDRSLSSLTQQLHLLLVNLKGDGYESVQKIHILGLGSSIQNLATYLFKVFKIPVHLLEQHQNYPSLKPPSFIALGLALSGCQRPKNPPVDLIENLKPTTEMMIQISKRKKRILKILTLTTLVLFTYTSLREWQSSRLLNKIDPVFSSYARSIVGLKTRNLSVKNVESFLKNKQEIAQKTKSYQSVQTTLSSMDLLKRLSLTLRDYNQWDLELVQLEINGTLVNMRGMIQKDHLESLTKQLKTLALKGQVKNLIQKDKQASPPQPLDADSLTDTTIPFHITFSIKT